MYTSYLKKKINQKWQNRLQLDKKNALFCPNRTHGVGKSLITFLLLLFLFLFNFSNDFLYFLLGWRWLTEREESWEMNGDGWRSTRTRALHGPLVVCHVEVGDVTTFWEIGHLHSTVAYWILAPLLTGEETLNFFFSK